MARPQSAGRRGYYSTGQMPNLPCWENTMQTSYNSQSAEELYMNTESMERLPPLRNDDVDVYKKFYTFAELTSTFELPRSVRVVEGYYGASETSEVPQNSVLLLCFKKDIKVVLAEAANQMVYSIPRDSSLKYIPLDPTYDLQGHVYTSVEEILSCSELPKAVHIDAHTAYSLRLHSGEQLIFPARKEPNTFGKSCLVCYDQRGNKFNLPPTQCGSFSTKPDNIRMDMDDCTKYIRKFPIRVVVCDVNNTMPPGTDGSILILTEIKNEAHVVVKVTEGNSAKIFEIPVDIPVKMQCFQTNQQWIEAEAEEVLEAYRNSTVEYLCSRATTETAYEVQRQLYKNVKPQSPAAQLDKYVMRRQVKSVSEDSRQRRHTVHEPLYENLVDYQMPPQVPPKPQKSQTVDGSSNGYHAQARQSMSLPNEAKLSTQKIIPPQAPQSVPLPTATPSVPQPQPPSNTVPPKTASAPKPQPIQDTVPSKAPPVSQPQLPAHNTIPPKTTSAPKPQPIEDTVPSKTPPVSQPQLPARNTIPPKTFKIPKQQLAQDTVPPKAPPVTQPQPTHNNAPSKAPPNIPQSHRVTPAQEKRPPPTHANTDKPKDDEQKEEIYTVIPSTELEDEDADDYVHVISPPVATNAELFQHQQKQIQKLMASNEELRTQLMQVTVQLTQVTSQVTQLEASVAQILQLVVTRKPEDNIKQLSFMDSEKVLMMLQAMGLSMYEHIFRQHKVDGAKMTRLDMKKLSQYGITNPQDQTKLTDVIKGTISPLSYLLRQPAANSNSEDTYDNYVRFTKT